MLFTYENIFVYDTETTKFLKWEKLFQKVD